MNKNFTTAFKAPDGRIKLSESFDLRGRDLNDEDDDDVEWTDTNSYYGN